MAAQLAGWGHDGGLAEVASARVGDDGRQSGHSHRLNGAPVTVSVEHTNHPALCAARSPRGPGVSQVRQFMPPTIRNR
jgi:hypothetical protein